MYKLRPEFCLFYSSFLQDIRSFFKKQGFLELETPLLTSTASVEAYLDSFRIQRAKLHKSPHIVAEQEYRTYLITSPENHLKGLLAHLRRNIYQIAHCFRSGDLGPLHMEEFLMLEWYFMHRDEFAMMEHCAKLLSFLSKGKYSRCRLRKKDFARRSVKSALEEYAKCSWEREDLEKTLRKHGLQEKLEKEAEKEASEKNAEKSYSDLFFSVFLNLVEPHLGKKGPEFLYHYPPELSAFSQVEKGYARRFELYWKGLELLNGYYELTQKEDYSRRFAEENSLRKKIGKEAMPPDESLLRDLERCQGLPECSGVALGLDCLFLALLDEKKLSSVYNYDSPLV